MKVKVVKSFIDKETKNVRMVNETFDCTENRLKEIQKAGKYVEPVDETKKEQK